jgi:hypothetical protein
VNCKEALYLTHEHLDLGLKNKDLLNLHSHFEQCSSCKTKHQDLLSLEKTVRSIYSSQEHVDLKPKIMSMLPSSKKTKWNTLSWLHNYPGLSVAVLFCMVMFSSFIWIWNQDREFAVKTNELDKIIIEGQTIIVPQNQVIEGDIIVHNGNLQVEGEVHGDLIVMDGKILLASTAQFTGQSLEIDQVSQWLWYKSKKCYTWIINQWNEIF